MMRMRQAFKLLAWALFILVFVLIPRVFADDVDTDRDGLPDVWEQQYPNLTHNINSDDDHDELNNGQEFLYGTNPLVPETNLLKNPSFEDSLTPDGKIPFWEGNSSTITRERDMTAPDGNFSVQIVNDSSNQYYLSQSYNYRSTDPIYISYSGKLTSVSAGALTTLDLIATYSDGSAASFIKPDFFGLTEENLGNWVKKELVFAPAKEVSTLVPDLLDYFSPATVHYDDIKLFRLAPQQEWQFTGRDASFAISSYGFISSIKKADGTEVPINEPVPLVEIVTQDNRTLISQKIESIGNNRFTIHFVEKDKTQLEKISLIVSVESNSGYTVFSLQSIANSDEIPIKKLKLLNLAPRHIPTAYYYKDWAIGAEPGEIFVTAMPLTSNVECNWNTGRVICESEALLGLDNAQAALLVTPKSEFENTIERIAQETIAPDFFLYDGKFLRKSAQLNEGYLLTHLQKTNDALPSYCAVPYSPDSCPTLQYAQLAGIKHIVMIDALKFGSYDQPRNGYTLDELEQLSQQLNARGIYFGIHTYLNYLNSSNTLVNFSSPASEFPLNETIYTFPIGTLDSIDNATGCRANSVCVNLSVNMPPGQSLNDHRYFSYYFGQRGPLSGIYFGKHIIIDNEIFKCDSFVGNTLENCERGQYTTQIGDHAVGETGAKVLVAPSKDGGTFFMSPLTEAGKNAQEMAARGLVDTLRRLNATMLYVDGIPLLEHPDTNEMGILNEEKAVKPYLEAMASLPFKPLIQGMGSGTLHWFYSPRSATDDGAMLRECIQIKDCQVRDVASDNPYDIQKPEFSWWKPKGSYLHMGFSDLDATSLADVHYLMSKALSFETSASIETWDSLWYQKNAFIDNIFSTIGQYNEIIQNEELLAAVPEPIKNYLKIADNEAELNVIGNTRHFVKKHTERTYVDQSPKEFSFTNPFGNQPVRFEIRPRFDYYGFDDTRNQTITNFSNVQDIRTFSDMVTCSMQNGMVTIQNASSAVGGCEIKVPISRMNLSRQRGLGLRFDSDTSNVLIMVRLQDLMLRDFKYLVPQAGEQTVIFGDPTVDGADYVDGAKVDWGTNWYDYLCKLRSWEFDYRNVNQASLFINHV
ncbi:MAG: hypothetical protein HY582_03290, partial [Candidatus Omnitrophica bacterium]|nr:hypothetical protein [Candidatus Omnitrophota bacterium]